MSIQRLVSTDWLADNLSNVKVLDGSWYLPLLKRDTLKEFEEKRIPSAHFFDIDKIADLQTKLPHMLPTPEFFAESVGKMGISNQDHVVVYDSAGVTSSTRVYWTFQIFGHTRISVLDGGLVKWIAEKRPLESGLKTTSNAVGSRKYTSKFQPQLLKSYQDMVQIVENQSAAIVDARPAPRFNGLAAEPRPGIPSGKMPGSINVAFNEVVNQETKTLFSVSQLRQLFTERGIDLDDTGREIVNSCGSGVTASVTYFALQVAGAKGPLSLYDGSWAEYAKDPKSKIDNKGPLMESE